MTDEVEIVLAGGIANQGAVVRVGDTVRRPPRRESPAIHALLAHLEAVGFEEAPRFLGLDGAGREVFSYIDGIVGVPPFEGAFASDDALVEAARLLSRYHEAVASFDHHAVDGWSEELQDAGGDEVVCHNDMCVENVVFRDGRAVGLLDFDFAAPGRRVWDLAMAARMWAPMVDPRYRKAWVGELDAVARLGRFARAGGVDPDDAVAFVDAVFATKEAGRAFVRRHVDAGEPGFVEMWATYLGSERDAADTVWMQVHRDRLIEAVAG